MKRYRLSHQGQELGLFTLSEIVSQVQARKVDLFDYIFVDEKNDWVLLMEFPELAEQLKSAKPPKPPKPSVVEPSAPAPRQVIARSEHEVSDWYVLKGDHRFGPFEYEAVIKMLQQKIIYPFDWIWHSGLKNWVRINDLQDFQPETLRELMDARRHEAFAQRQFKRHSVDARIFVHDSVTLWKGKARELSMGGMGVTLPSHLLIPGQKVVVHFKQDAGIPAFNAECEVISKSFEPDPSKDVVYGLKFVRLSGETQEILRQKVA